MQKLFTMHLKIIICKIILKQNQILHHLGNRDKDLDQQIDILNKLDLEGMDICSEKKSL